MLDLGLLLAGVVGLWSGTELVLRGALTLTDRFGLSQSFVGLTILAVGTDLPELVVAVSGGIQQLGGLDASGVIVGNATGSAIAQGSLVLGIAGLLTYVRMAPRLIRRDGLTLLLSIVLLVLLSLDGRIERHEGAGLLIVYAIYFVALVQGERRSRAVTERPPGDQTVIQIGLLLTSGLLLVGFSAHIVVERAVSLSDSWGVSQTFVGVLLIGAGTSLPELALSVGAAAKGRTSLSVGNVIGSNTFDLLVPVGASSVLYPLSVARETLSVDLSTLAFITVITFAFFLRRRGLQRVEAMILLGLYVGYVSLRILLV